MGLLGYKEDFVRGGFHLDLVLQHRLAALETREEDLALARLEAVYGRRDRAHVVRVGKVDELLVRGCRIGC